MKRNSAAPKNKPPGRTYAAQGPVVPLGTEDLNMELNAYQMTLIVHEAIKQFRACPTSVTDPVTPQATFDGQEQEEKAALEDQTLQIIENPRVRPAELHETWCDTSLKMMADSALDPKFIARLKPYMVPFRELTVGKKTEIRLHLQLVRTLLRHNRNVKRDQKRQRQRQALSG